MVEPHPRDTRIRGHADSRSLGWLLAARGMDSHKTLDHQLISSGNHVRSSEKSERTLRARWGDRYVLQSDVGRGGGAFPNAERLARQTRSETSVLELDGICARHSTRNPCGGRRRERICVQDETPMSQNRLYIGNLPFGMREAELYDEFGKCGTVVRATIVTDRETGRSRGFGFVEMSSDDEASAAIEAWDGQELGGRTLQVNHARPREERGNGGFRRGTAFRSGRDDRAGARGYFE